MLAGEGEGATLTALAEPAKSMRPLIRSLPISLPKAEIA
jgi:hypothetical protein